MLRSEALDYVSGNLGIDIAASNFHPDQNKIQHVVDSFPYKGILLVTGNNHLIKAGRLAWELLKADKIIGSIERFESWEPIEVSRTVSLLLYTNITEDLVKPQFLVGVVTLCMRFKIPMIFTTPLTIEALDGSLPMSVVSNIVPYLYGDI